MGDHCHPSHHHGGEDNEEYTDYSCSTAVERLSRDVESLLRSWHIHDGCDRHFSISSNPHGLTVLRSQRFFWVATLPDRRTVRVELELALWDGPALVGPGRSSSNSSGSKKKQQRNSRRRNSTATTANVTNSKTKSKSTSRRRYSTLEKGKSQKHLKAKRSFLQRFGSDFSLTGSISKKHSKSSNDLTLGNDDDDTMDASSSSIGMEDPAEALHLQHLPYSLRQARLPQHVVAGMPVSSLLDNFSTLFGIGQHITLTPVNPLADLELQQNIFSPQQQQQQQQLQQLYARMNDDDATVTSTSSYTTAGMSSAVGMSEPSIVSKLCSTLMARHKPDQARWVLNQLLSGWLQTALNCAAQQCQCCIPVFGFWGKYSNTSSSSCPKQPESNDGRVPNTTCSGLSDKQPQQQQPQQRVAANPHISIFPEWLQAAQSMQLPVQQPRKQRRRWRRKRRTNQQEKNKSQQQSLGLFLERDKMMRHHDNNNNQEEDDEDEGDCEQWEWRRNATYAPAFLFASVVPTTYTYANFTLHVLPRSDTADGQQQQQHLTSGGRLSAWGNLLLQNCPDDTVILSGARHVYAWWKRPACSNAGWFSRRPSIVVEPPNWRGENPTAILDTSAAPEHVRMTTYEKVERYKQRCRAYALRLLEQSAGSSPEKPSWGPVSDPVASIHVTATWKSSQLKDGTMQPLLSFPHPIQTDSAAAEASLERTILDPLKGTAEVKIQAFLDKDVLEPTLATTQRCILAGLVRTGTLAPLTMLRHIIWKADISRWNHEAGNDMALKLANQGQASPSTLTLVDVMDWKTCAEEMISPEEAEEIVLQVLEASPSLFSAQGFPSPPESMWSAAFSSSPTSTGGDSLFAPLLKSAPMGRLLSDLFVRMAQLRTPCSMALVWSTFCCELRQLWECRRSLPNMHHVAGLDLPRDQLSERRKTAASTIGLKADHAAFVYSTEPDPDDQHCLIGQKLQLFNVGVETMASTENRSSEDQNTSYASNEFLPDIKTCEGPPSPTRTSSSVSLESNCNSSGAEADHASGSGHEIVNVVNISSLISGDFPAESEFFGTDYALSYSREIATNAVSRVARKGARCPVRGCGLVASGDQVYAPYLQRPQPLTDDVIRERRWMLSEEHSKIESKANQGPTPIQTRLEIAHRLQRPKLLSDMCSFKAANPGSVFQDFVNWYGNPENLLDEYGPSLDDSTGSRSFLESPGRASAETVASMQSDAIFILTKTRDLWSNTWDEAQPRPASEQKPLYDAFKTVEMALNELENIHPAILMNQVMAVNLASAFFLLAASAKDTINIELVNLSFRRLRREIEYALELLSDEASEATCSISASTGAPKPMSEKFVSSELISLCESACTALSEVEKLVSLATALLTKFPEQYELVQTILMRGDGEEIELRDLDARKSILGAVLAHQSQTFGAAQDQDQQIESEPKPVLKDYVLRNLDDSRPCQLCVRYGDEAAMLDNSGRRAVRNGTGGLIVALGKSVHD